MHNSLRFKSVSLVRHCRSHVGVRLSSSRNLASRCGRVARMGSSSVGRRCMGIASLGIAGGCLVVTYRQPVGSGRSWTRARTRTRSAVADHLVGLSMERARHPKRCRPSYRSRSRRVSAANRSHSTILTLVCHSRRQYVAANRGSVHVAPLTGHIQSVSSTNVQPAPGTTW